MAPTKSSISTRSSKDTASAMVAAMLPIARKGVSRSKNVQDQNSDIQTRTKRKADQNSPIKNEKIKRSALGNLTNNAKMLSNAIQHSEEDAKQKQQQFGKKMLGGISNVLKDTQNTMIISNDSLIVEQHSKVLTRSAAKNAKKTITMVATKTFCKVDNVQTVGPPPPNKLLPPPAPMPASNAALPIMPAKIGAHKSTRRISNEFNKTEDSLYMSALEDISCSDSIRLSDNFETVKRRSILLQQQQQQQQQQQNQLEKDLKKAEEEKDSKLPENKEDADDGNYKDDLSFTMPPIPAGVDDFDQANWNDPFQVSNYAMDIFNYLKSRENQFIIDDYIVRQIHLSKWMRSLLVDWMVEVQETFELNHETLYLAVKIVDLFLCKIVLQKDRLQLLGAASLFIACKYDERTPPLIEDFLYICDGAYKHEELVKMEMAVLRTIDYDLGIPLSYRFLRRYARCAKVTMPTLTLARYALELSLLDYETISLSDSRLACAALFIALRLHGQQKAWSPTLEYYTGYKIIDFADIVPILNAGMHRKPKESIKNIRNKYSHKIFHEVAKVKLMTTEKLFEHDLNLNISLKIDVEKNLPPA